MDIKVRRGGIIAACVLRSCGGAQCGRAAAGARARPHTRPPARRAAPPQSILDKMRAEGTIEKYAKGVAASGTGVDPTKKHRPPPHLALPGPAGESSSSESESDEDEPKPQEAPPGGWLCCRRRCVRRQLACRLPWARLRARRCSGGAAAWGPRSLRLCRARPAPARLQAPSTRAAAPPRAPALRAARPAGRSSW